MLQKLNDSVYKFKKDRILSKLKSGGAIPKFQWGSIINNIEANNQQMQQEFVQPVIDYSSQIVSKGASKKAAERKLNRKVKSPMKPADNSVLELQDKLWRAGAFKGVKDRRGRELTYEQAVDGINGNWTKQAMANMKAINPQGITNQNGTPSSLEQMFRQSVHATDNTPQQSLNTNKFITTSGAFIPSQVIERTAQSTRPYAEELGDFIGHNPVFTLVEDIDRASSNRIIEALTGKRPFEGRTITKLPSLQQQELINQVKFARDQGVNYFNSDMYNKMYQYNYGSRNGLEGENRSGIWNRINTPRARLEHTLGQYNFYTDENGNVIVTDIYDFNDDQKQGGEGRYVNIRNDIAGTYGSRSSDPIEGKIKYKINLGKL